MQIQLTPDQIIFSNFWSWKW